MSDARVPDDDPAHDPDAAGGPFLDDLDQAPSTEPSDGAADRDDLDGETPDR